jgi:hypothetical protein
MLFGKRLKALQGKGYSDSAKKFRATIVTVSGNDSHGFGQR